MYDAAPRAYLSRALADAFLAGDWEEQALRARAEQVLVPRQVWVRRLTRAVLAAYVRAPADRPRELGRFIELWLFEREPYVNGPDPPHVRQRLAPRLAMGDKRWPVPELATLDELATFLGATHGELAWLADVRGLERTVVDEQLRHYRYVAVPRGGRPPRLIEQPKQRLKEVQRQILREIIERVPLHEAAHGFTRGRSVRSHAAAHTGRYAVMRLDLEDFFASVAAARVYGIFRTAGYPEGVAHTLTGLTTNVVPASFWETLARPAEPAQISAHQLLGRRLATPHLPQGAPTSPALANLAAFTLDRRLTGLAASFGLTYTRYADDLTFSGSARLVRNAATLRAAARTIVNDEGFRVNERKSLLATRAGRQRVCGVVVNQHLNVARGEYDLLKAILHNARLHGPGSQNRQGVPDFRAHLLGRIAWVASLNPDRGAKLRQAFAEIQWDAAEV